VKEEMDDVVNWSALITPIAPVSEEIDDPVNCVAFKNPVFVTKEEIELVRICALLKDPVETEAIFALLPIYTFPIVLR